MNKDSVIDSLLYIGRSKHEAEIVCSILQDIGYKNSLERCYKIIENLNNLTRLLTDEIENLKGESNVNVSE